MSEILKPCPFCGSPAYSYHDNCIDFAGVKCDLGGCVCADILITENNWNTRPIEDALNARIAELKAETAELKERVAILDITAVYKSLGEMGCIEQVTNLKAENAALQSRIAELEEAQRWIPVSERLPEENQIVAVIDTCGNGRHSHISSLYEVAAWVKVKGDKMFRFIHDSNWSSCDVTHWMPLPSVPEPPEVK